jgi:D-glycero-D-manno-heptose 1,7-bisphosphate phosphatase
MTGSLRPAVFFDRDGVLNRACLRDGKPYPPQTLEEFEIVPDARESLTKLKRLGFLLIVVTNQPDIARGTQSQALIDEIHARLKSELPIDDLLVCPHDDRDACDCRKPRPGLLLSAARRHGIDLNRSFLVGDRWRDIDAGRAVGCATIMIDFAYKERGPTQEPGWRVHSLADAVSRIRDSVISPKAS